MASTVPLSSSRLRSVLLIVAAFIFFFSAYVLSASGDIQGTGDTGIRIDLAENILNRHAFDLLGWRLEYPHHIKKEFIETRVAKGRGGNVYSTYLLGQPLFIVPFDLAAYRLTNHERWPLGPTVSWTDKLVGPLFGALEVTLFFLFALRLGYGRGWSLLLTLIFAFASSVWPDEQSALEHTEVAFFILLGFYFAYRFREQGAKPFYLVLAGAAIGGAAITRYQDGLLGVFGVGLYLLLPGLRWPGIVGRIRALFLAGMGFLPFAALNLWYSWVRFGSPLATGHAEKVFGNPIWLGVGGLLISPGKGLLWYSPIILLLVFAAPRFLRRFPALGVAGFATSGAFVLFYAYVVYWHGDPAWGPRYIYPILPYVVLPLGEIFRFQGRRARAVWLVTALVVLASFTIQLAGVSVSEWRTWYRVISYEELRGQTWQWDASRYRYFWNVHESPVLFQLHGLYQLAYDDLLHSTKYEIVPPVEDPILDNLSSDYALNQWNFWWGNNEFNWWMDERKVIGGVIMLLGVMGASGTYLAAETAGAFAGRRRRSENLETLQVVVA